MKNETLAADIKAQHQELLLSVVCFVITVPPLLVYTRVDWFMTLYNNDQHVYMDLIYNIITMLWPQ